MQEHFQISLCDGEELLAQLERELVADPGCLAHPQHPQNAHLVCAGPTTAQIIKARLTQDPQSPLNNVGLLILGPSEVRVFQSASVSVLERIQAFLTPLLQAEGVVILDEEGHERADLAKNPSLLFER